MGKLKVSRGGCLAIIINICLGIFLFEIGLRVLAPTATFTAFGRPCSIVADSQLGFRFIPNSTSHLQLYNEIDNHILTNSEGFHDIEHDLNAKTNRILVLGDSFTAANQVPIAAGWTQIVEQQLEDTSVINLGVDGYGTDRQLKLLKHYAPLIKPEIVILAFYENDITEISAQTKMDCYDDYLLVYQTDTQKQKLMAFLDENKPSKLSYMLANHLVSYRFLATLLNPAGFLLIKNTISINDIGISLTLLPGDPSELMSDIFAQFEELAEEYDFEMIVIPVPGRDNPELSSTLLEDHVNQKEWSRIRIINVYPEMEAKLDENGLEHKDLYFVYDGHFNESGYALFGQQVAHTLQTKVLNKTN